MKIGKYTLPTLLMIALAGCATPNLQPWAESTAELSAGVSTEHGAVLTRMKVAQDQLKAWNSTDKRIKKIEEERAAYARDSKRIEAVLDLAVDYSNVLAELAKAGETGATSVCSMIQKISQPEALVFDS